MRNALYEKILYHIGYYKNVVRNRVHIYYPFCFVIIALVIIFTIAYGIVYIGDENILSFGDAVWWGVVTFTTVGYGDLYPSATEGRILAFTIMISGFIFTSVISGIIASIFVEHRLDEAKGLKEVRMKGHIAICGWNESARSLLETLPSAFGTDLIHIVLINQLEADEINRLKAAFPTYHIKYVQGNYFDEDILKRANISEALAAIILLDSEVDGVTNSADERTILTAFTIKSIAPNVKIAAEISRRENMAHLRRAEVDEIIVKGEFLGFLLSNAVASTGVVETVREMLTFNEGSTLLERKIPHAYIGRTFDDLSDYFSNKKDAVLIGVISPQKQLALKDLLNDDLSEIDSFIKKKFSESDMNLSALNKVNQRVKLNPGKNYHIKENDCAILICKDHANV
jgi:voltage-gated potassium channel